MPTKTATTGASNGPSIVTPAVDEIRLRAYKFALDPTAEQSGMLRSHAGSARWAFNYALAIKKERMEAWRLAVDELVTLGCTEKEYKAIIKTMSGLRIPGHFQIANYFTANRELESDPRRRCMWWREVSRRAFVSGFDNADKAFDNWFASLSGRRKGRPVGFPRFKKRGSKDSFTLRGVVKVVDYRHVQLPRIGKIRIHDTAKRLVRKIERNGATIQSVTVSRGANKWYASMLVKETVPVATPTHAQVLRGSIGVDVGVAELAGLSDGTLIANPRWAGRDAKKLKKAQRNLSRKVGSKRGEKQSANFKKAKTRVATIQHLTAVRRQSNLHQITKKLTTTYAHVAIEDLKIANMTRGVKAKPDPENEGQYLPNGKAAKSGLNRSILDVGWGEFRRQLEYKAAWYGAEIVAVPAFYTSMTCSQCLHCSTGNRKSQAEFKCEKCGYENNADINAAINIHNAAFKKPNEIEEVTCNKRETQNACGGNTTAGTFAFQIPSNAIETGSPPSVSVDTMAEQFALTPI